MVLEFQIRIFSKNSKWCGIMKNQRLILFLIIPALFLAGCSIPDNTAEMWTSIPELAAYADLFNSSQSTFRVKVVYKENPGHEFLRSGVIPDLIIDTGLNSRRYSSHFSDLNFLFDEKKGHITKDAFYPGLLDLSSGDNQLLTLPMSFNLPLLYYKAENSGADERNALLDQSEIQRRAMDFEAKGTPGFPVRGFSPLWNGMYIFSLMQLRGVSFHEDDDGNIRWNQEVMDKTFREIETWRSLRGRTLTEEMTFMEKYLYQPPYKLILQGRILYSYSTAWDFYQIPNQERHNLAFHWMSDGRQVPVLDSILFAAVPRKGEDKKAAAEFLSWFFRVETQEEILEYTQFNRIRSFGIARGFSSLISVTGLAFSKYYPALLGTFPAPGELLFPRILPPEWGEMSRDLIPGWLLSTAQGLANTPPLEEALRTWYNQRGRY